MLTHVPGCCHLCSFRLRAVTHTEWSRYQLFFSRLVSSGMAVHALAKYRRSLMDLLYARRASYTQEFKAIQESYAQLVQPSTDNDIPILQQIVRGQTHIDFESLLARRPDTIEEKDGDGRTALWWGKYRQSYDLLNQSLTRLL